MAILWWTLGLLALFFGVHLVVWRIHVPRKPFFSLLVIVGTIFIIALTAAVTLSIPVLTFLHVTLFYMSTSLCYIVLYSAIYQESPTLSLMRFIAESPQYGRSTAEVVEFLAQHQFVKSRLAELTESRLIREQEGRFVVSGTGSFGFRLILFYRKLYGPIPKGG
jgi:hypothetical protein